MTTASIELGNIGAQIAELRKLWNELAAQGKHAEAVGVENEIAALERSSARYEIQQKAERTERKRQQAVDAANSTLEQIEKHKAARVEMEVVVAELERHAAAIVDTFKRLDPAWTKCSASFPRWEQFKDAAMQAAYDEALAGNRYPRFDALRLRLRLPLAMSVIRERVNGGLNHILQAADARF